MPMPQELSDAEAFFELAKQEGKWPIDAKSLILVNYHLGVAPLHWPKAFSRPNAYTTPCPVMACSNEEHEIALAQIENYFADLTSFGMDEVLLWKAIDSIARRDAIVAMTQWERERFEPVFS